MSAPDKHDHNWEAAGKRWDVCTISGCAVVRLGLRVKWYDSEKKPWDNPQEKSVWVLLQGEEA